MSSFRLTHDVGGDLSAHGPIIGTKSAGELLAWEQQCNSLFVVLASKKFIATDEVRRSVEALTPEQYESWSYYEKWSSAMTTLLLASGVITNLELQEALFGSSTQEADVRENPHPQFKTGDSVRVRKFLSGTEWKRPHIRTPGYIYGVCGEIERVCGLHGDPSFLAFGLKAPQVQLYRVRFSAKDIWPEQYQNEDAHGGEDVVEVEVYEHWLEASSSSVGHGFPDQALFDHTSGDDCSSHSHHDHQHHHHHGEEHVPHVHEPRPTVEERAVRLEGPPRPGQELFRSLFKLLLEKDIVTADEIRNMSERMDTAGKRLDGATLVVKAWLDPSFGERLISDAGTAAAEIGISASNPNAPTVLTVVQNTPTTHNLVVCTLCSCYPSGLLGLSPSWYKSRQYRSRAVREPRSVLAEFGVSIPPEKKIRVHDSSADHRYFVLPERPPGTEGWSEEELRALVTRDTMIGVAIPQTPGV
jgi:nitrile hydratase